MLMISGLRPDVAIVSICHKASPRRGIIISTGQRPVQQSKQTPRRGIITNTGQRPVISKNTPCHNPSQRCTYTSPSAQNTAVHPSTETSNKNYGTTSAESAKHWVATPFALADITTTCISAVYYREKFRKPNCWKKSKDNPQNG